jgi:hypothetical protein
MNIPKIAENITSNDNVKDTLGDYKETLLNSVRSESARPSTSFETNPFFGIDLKVIWLEMVKAKVV